MDTQEASDKYLNPLTKKQQDFIDAYSGPCLLDQRKACEVAGCSMTSIFEWKKKDPRFLEEYEKVREQFITLAESGLLALLRERDPQTVRYVLDRRGKKAGWNTDQSIDHTTGGQPIKVIFMSPKDESKDNTDIQD